MKHVVSNDVLKLATRILLRRRAALGDVIMTTPIVRRLRHIVGPNTFLAFETMYPDVFLGNPAINSTHVSFNSEDFDVTIDLDEAYETRREMHTVDAYMMQAFGDAEWPAKEMFLDKHPLPADLSADWQKAVVLHPGQTDPSRTILPKTWEGVVERLIRGNLVPIIIGQNREVTFSRSEGVVDATGRLSLQQVAKLIQYSRCFISADTGMSHVAGTTETPIVTVFTSIRPELRMPWRHGLLGWRVTPLVPDLPCVGCTHTQSCQIGFACVEGSQAVDADEIFRAVSSAINR